MRRVIRKRIRRTGDGVDLAVDFNADVAINVGRSNASTIAGEEPAAEPTAPDEKEPTDGNTEGTEP